MSRESRRRRREESGGTGAPWSKIAAVVAFLVVLAVAAGHRTGSAHHPEPRAGLDHASHVMPAERYAAYPRVARTYEMVAAVPALVDGIYCYCHCSEHSGHHSLLDCFASDHGARCDVCLSEATMTYLMSREGHDLKAIRSAIDDRYGG